jgi:hypothetical protein
MHILHERIFMSDFQKPDTANPRSPLYKAFAILASLLTPVLTPAMAQGGGRSFAPQPTSAADFGTLTDGQTNFTIPSSVVAPPKPRYFIEIGEGNDSWINSFGNLSSDGGGYTGGAVVNAGVRNTDGTGYTINYSNYLYTPQRDSVIQYSHNWSPYVGVQTASVGWESGPSPNAYGVGVFGGVSGNDGMGAEQDFYHRLLGFRQPNWNLNPGKSVGLGGVNGWVSREWMGAPIPIIGGHVGFTTDAQAAVGVNLIKTRLDADIAFTTDGANRLPRDTGQAGMLSDVLAQGYGFRIGPVLEYSPVDPSVGGGIYAANVKALPVQYGIGASAQIKAFTPSLTLRAAADALTAAYVGAEKPLFVPGLPDARATLSLVLSIAP